MGRLLRADFTPKHLFVVVAALAFSAAHPLNEGKVQHQIQSLINLDTYEPRLGNHKVELRHPHLSFGQEDHAKLTSRQGGILKAAVEKVVQGWATPPLQDFKNEKNNDTADIIANHRFLQNGFDELNDLLAETQIVLPPTSISTGGVDIDITDTTCSNINLHNLQVGHIFPNKNTVDLKVNVIDIDIFCSLSFRYEWSFFRGGSTATMKSIDSDISATISFTSPDYNTQPPTGSSVSVCEPNIEISSIDVKVSGPVSAVLSIFEGALKGTVKRELNDFACEELTALGSESVQDFIQNIAVVHNGYLSPLPPSRSNPLHPENNMVVPSGVQLLRLDNVENFMGEWIRLSLDKIDSMLGSVTDDKNSPTGTGKDLGINKILRSSILNNNRVLVLPTADILKAQRGTAIIFSSNDLLTDSTIELTEVRLLGLDTIKRFDPLDDLGKYTLMSSIQWEHLTFEIDLTIIMKASSHSSSVIVGGNGNVQTEYVTIELGANGVSIDFDFLLAFDQTKLGDIHIGSLVQVDQILPCIMGAVHQLEVTKLVAAVSEVLLPKFKGFISQGVSRVVTDASRAVFDMYDQPFLHVLPTITQLDGRDGINNMINQYLSDSKNLACPPFQSGSGSGLVDFRDLLLFPGDSSAFGGSGTEPYGEIIPFLKDIFDDQLLGVNSDGGGLLLNSLLIGPVTKSRSGIAGTVSIPSILDVDKVFDGGTTAATSIVSSLVDRFRFRIFDAAIQNIDTLCSPITLLEPDASGPQTLQNTITICPNGDPSTIFGPGTNQRELGIKSKISFDIEGANGSPFDASNELDIKLTIPSVALFVELFAAIKERDLMEFPLENVVNYHCWLSIISSQSSSKALDSIAVTDMLITLASLSVDMNCADCTTKGLQELPEIINTVETAGGIGWLKDSIALVVAEFLEGDWLPANLGRIATESSKQCPHHSNFDENYSPSTETKVDTPLPPLSRNSVELLIYGSVLLFESLTVVVAKNYAFRDSNSIDISFTKSESINIPPETALLDLTNLGDLADSALSTVQEILGQKTDDGDLRINDIVRSSLLVGKKKYSLDFDKFDFEFMGVKAGLKSARIGGLDTFANAADLVRILGPQSIISSFKLNTLTLDLVLSLELDESTSRRLDPRRAAKTEEMILSIAFKDIAITASAIVPIDKNSFNALYLGSFLTMDQELTKCLLSTVLGVEIVHLSVAMGDAESLKVSGFISNELKTVLDSTSNALDLKYKQDILAALPNFFDSSIRVVLNTVLKGFFENPRNCLRPSLGISTSFVDWRDLFLKPQDALAFGATGNSPYGTIPSMIWEYIETNITSGDPPLINNLIASATKSQSGIEGTFRIPGTLLSVNATNTSIGGVDKIQLSISDAQIQDIDSFGSPLRLLHPNSADPHVLDTDVAVGIGDKSLRAAVRFMFDIDGDESLAMQNELNLEVDVGIAGLIAAVMAKVEAASLMDFPIQNFLDVNCWLALFPTPLLDDVGMRLDGIEPSLAVPTLDLFLSELSLNISCISCSSPGFVRLQEIIDLQEAAGMYSALKDRILSYAEAFVKGDVGQSYIDRMLAAAPSKCPHDPSYDENYVAIEYERPSSDELSEDLFEILSISGAAIAQAGIGVIVNNYPSEEFEATDPLAREKSLDFPEGTKLFNLDSLDTVGGGLIGRLNSLGPVAINLFIRRLLDEDGALSFSLNNTAIDIADINIDVKSVRVFGLDTLKDIDLISVIGNFTMSSSFQWRRLSVEIDVSVTISGAVQHLKLKLGARDVNVDASVLVAIDEVILGNVEIGSMLDLREIVPCMLSAARILELTQLVLSVGSLDGISVSGFDSQEVNDVISSSTSATFSHYEAAMLKSLPKIFDGAVRTLLNGALRSFMEEMDCSEVTFILSDTRYVDLRDLLLPEALALELGGRGGSPYGSGGQLLKNLVDNVLSSDGIDGISKVNELLIEPLTKAQSGEAGTLRFPGDIFNEVLRLTAGGLNMLAGFQGSNATIGNLNTLGEPIEVLEPMRGEPTMLNNTFTFGVGPDDLHASMELLLAINNQGDAISNELDIKVDMSEVKVVSSGIVKILESDFFSFPLRKVTNPYCWLTIIEPPKLTAQGIREAGVDPNLAISSLNVTVEEFRMHVSCTACTSPGLEEFSALLSKPEAIDDATNTVNRILEYVGNLLGGEFVQVQIDRLLNEAESRCNGNFDPTTVAFEPFNSPQRDYGSMRLLFVLILVAAGVALISVAFGLAMRWIVHKRHQRWVDNLSEDAKLAVIKRQLHEQEVENELCRRTQTMAFSPMIPLVVRVLMPFIILGNIAFFLSGHLSRGATVIIEVELAGETLSVDNFFEFSMAKSTVDMWDAGAKELAIFILLFSGIWPYTKQLITLALWFAPPTRVSLNRRLSIFLWLDALAKWSMVDIFVLVISLASFWVKIDSPEVDFLPDGFYSVHLLVVPLWGLYANMTAQLISQVSSHFIIHYHRKIAATAKREMDIDMGQGSNGSVENLVVGANSDAIIDTSSDVFVDTSSDSKDGEESFIENNGEEAFMENNGEEAFIEDDRLALVTTVSEDKKALRSHTFKANYSASSAVGGLKVRRFVDVLVICLSLTCIILVILGCTFSTISLEILGLLGIAVESGQKFQEAFTPHSVFTIAGLMLDEAKFLGTGRALLGLGILALLFVATVLLVPIVQIGILACQWFIPITLKRRQQLLLSIEILQAWQYVEVYLVAIIVSSWQLGDVSEFMINEYCGALENTFSSMVYYGILEKNDAQCFRVQSRIESAAYMLLVAAIFLAFLSHFITKASNQLQRDESLSDVGKEELSAQELSMSSSEEEEKEEEEEEEYGEGVEGVEGVEEAFMPEPIVLEDGMEKSQHDRVRSSSIRPNPVLFTDSFRWMLNTHDIS